MPRLSPLVSTSRLFQMASNTHSISPAQMLLQLFSIPSCQRLFSLLGLPSRRSTGACQVCLPQTTVHRCRMGLSGRHQLLVRCWEVLSLGLPAWLLSRKYSVHRRPASWLGAAGRCSAVLPQHSCGFRNFRGYWLFSLPTWAAIQLVQLEVHSQTY